MDNRQFGWRAARIVMCLLALTTLGASGASAASSTRKAAPPTLPKTLVQMPMVKLAATPQQIAGAPAGLSVGTPPAPAQLAATSADPHSGMQLRLGDMSTMQEQIERLTEQNKILELEVQGMRLRASMRTGDSGTSSFGTLVGPAPIVQTIFGVQGALKAELTLADGTELVLGRGDALPGGRAGDRIVSISPQLVEAIWGGRRQPLSVSSAIPGLQGVVPVGTNPLPAPPITVSNPGFGLKTTAGSGSGSL